MTTVLGRNVLLPLPVLLTVPMAVAQLEKRKMMPVNKGGRAAIELGLIIGLFAVAFPFAIGIYPSVMDIPTSKLEPELQELTDKDGKKYEKLWFQRGC
jgi:hypothetical protein